MKFRLILFTVFSFLVFSFFSTAQARMMCVKSENVRLRSGPGDTYSIKWEYGKGFPLKIITSKKGWYKVSDFERDTGWIRRDLLSTTPHMVVKVNKNKKKKINIRSGPGTRFRTVGKAYYGVVFKTLEQKKGWTKVRHESGIVGWIKRSLLWGF